MNVIQNDNPFFHRSPIRDSRYFFGRARETRQALDMLRNGQCISIVGPRRIGKTSLLFHLCDPDVRKEHNFGEEYLFVYVDCQGLGSLDKPQFYQWIWQEIRRSLVSRGETDNWVESVTDFARFREMLMAIHEDGKYKPILLLDEFDTLAQNSSLDLNLFSDLRSLIVAQLVIYVTVSHDSLYDLTFADRSVLSSPFFNIFKEIRPRFLIPDKAEEMVLQSLNMVQQEDLFTEKDLAFIFDTGGYFPFFLQSACFHLFEHKVEHENLLDYESVRQDYAEDTQAHFDYMWQNLDENERQATWLIHKGGHISAEQRKRLEKKCILYDDTIFSSVFAAFVQQHMSASGIEKVREETIASAPGRSRLLDWLRKAGVTLVAILFVSSIIFLWPDLPDLKDKLLGIENVTTMSLQDTTGEILVKVYSPKLLFVGQTGLIEIQTYGPEKLEFQVIASPGSSDVVVTEKEGAFEIKCKGTSASILSQSTLIDLEVNASTPTGTLGTTIVTVKTNYFLSLLARLGFLLTGGGLSVKKVWEWLRGITRDKQKQTASEQIVQKRDESGAD